MTTRKKLPVTRSSDPPYPDTRSSSVDRRRFMAIIGGGAAAFLLSSCKKDAERLPGEEPRLDPPRTGGVVPMPDTDSDLPEPRVLPKVIIPGMVEASNDPADFAALPAGRTAHVSPEVTVTYRLYFSYSDSSSRELLALRAPQLLEEADRYLQLNCDETNLRGDGVVSRLRDGLRIVYARILTAEMGISFLDVELMRVQLHERTSGRVAPARHVKKPLPPLDDLEF